MVRVAVIIKDRCKPKYCNKECIRFCPLARTGKEAIKFSEELGRPVISEVLCTGCGICVKKCPFKAIYIVNLPEELEEECVHRYGPSGFKLYRLPIVKEGKVLGLIGPNAIGKTTVLKILAGELKPNLGYVDREPSWSEIIKHFRGTELQIYFEKLSRRELKVVHKPQFIDAIPRVVKGKVRDILSRVAERNRLREVIELLHMQHILDKDVSVLSGGELQKLAIAAAYLRDGDVYLFDEPSSHLDVRERLRAAKLIRRLASEGKTVVVVEHDLAVLDYVSDYVCVLYGAPGAYGIVSLPRGVRVGINEYLDGFLTAENMRIRPEPIRFRLRPPERQKSKERILLSWSRIVKKFPGFTLEVEPGEVYRGEVVGILGPNGIGKTTFVKILANVLEPDEGVVVPYTEKVRVSYKPQYIKPTTSAIVEEVFAKIDPNYRDKWVWHELAEPLQLTHLLKRDIMELSGGELQRVAIAACLLRDAEIYLLDEPLAYLDIEQRFAVAKVLRRIAEEREVTVFVVEHDVIMQDFIADAIMVFSGEPGVHGIAHAPVGLREGMNMFLRELDVTFRRDLHTGRPRINKEGSWLDRYQKEVLKEYYYIPEKPEEEREEEE
ncbi:MAG: ribosome biogenesis/translation initiation ATPase RLI [Thermoprotei archaeon]|nr:MAG: ribosome biogenesis/translation initiation ATPase RLI [Thermoprotei archaeon]